MADNKDLTQQGKQQRPDNGPAADPSRDGDRDGGFVHSAPDSNVFPSGAPQADNPGHAGGDSAAGTPDEGRLGGTGGTSAPGTTGNDPDR